MNNYKELKLAIKRASFNGNLKQKMFCYCIEKIGYSNKEIRDLEMRNKIYCYCKKKYSNHLNSLDYKVKDNGLESNSVWICWLQGRDNAPDIVKTCIKSVEFWLKDKDIHILDESNMFNYIDLPDHIIKKWKEGIISNTLFSDFVRLSVLAKYGGIWLDATVLLTGLLPDYVNDSDFFVYRCTSYDVGKFGESWFIKAKPNNRILLATLNLLNEYWKHENKIRDYFIMFIFMKIVCEKYDEDIKSEFNISSVIPHMLQKYLQKPFDPQIYKHICKITPIHKLTYKGINCEKRNSFYEKIIEGMINDGY